MNTDIIYPPPDIKISCDKTASFTAKYGAGFEDRVREREVHNPKFCFLSSNDPFHKYYLWKVEEEKKTTTTPTPTPTITATTPNLPVRHVPLPPSKPEFILYFSNISKLDLEIIKLTAQFTANNSALFMSELAQKEQRNYQFDFLKPSHSYYSYFTALVDQYSKVKLPSRQTLKELQNCSKESSLETIMKKVEFEVYLKQEVEKKAVEGDKEKIAFATIDWHDFVVVEVIEFLESDNQAILPPPVSFIELESMTLEERKDMVKIEMEKITADEDIDVDVDDDVVDIEIDEDEDIEIDEDRDANDKEIKAPQRYIPKVGRHAKSLHSQKCSICGVMVKDIEMAEHVKMEQADPRYREKRAALMAKEKGSNLVGGDSLALNISKLSTFLDTSKDNVTLADKIAFEKEKIAVNNPKVIWDGHAGSAALAHSRMKQLSSNLPTPPPPQSGIGPSKKVALTIKYQDKSFLLNDLTPLWTVSQLKTKLAPISGLAQGKQKLITTMGVVLKNSLTLHQCELKSEDCLTLAKK